MARTPTCATPPDNPRNPSVLQSLSVRRLRGFTLVELLVVFAILALVVGLAPPALEKMRESSQYRSTLRSLAAELRAARQQALLTRSPTRVVIDLAQHRFGLDGARTSHAIPETLQLRTTVAGIESTAEQAAIRFFPDGGSTGGSIEVIRPSGSGSRLQVDWLSGRVTQEALLP